MIDWRDLLNRLESRGAKAECPFCEGTLWMPGDASVALTVIGPDAKPGDVLVCAAFICVNCGFVRLHNPSVLDAAEESLRPRDE